MKRGTRQEGPPDDMAIFLPDLRYDGRVWEWWKGTLYRSNHSALPAGMLRDAGAEELDTGEWI